MSVRKERQIRKSRRVELRFTIGFSSGEIEGDAMVTNISTAGCRAESDINLAEGLEVQLMLQLPDQSPPIKIERASVRWVSDNAFGLSFILFFPSERARLRAFIENIKERSLFCTPDAVRSHGPQLRTTSEHILIVRALEARETALLFNNCHRHLNPLVR